MNLSKLKKQLARDLKKSPLKAAVLGLLCLVAMYSWAPLVWGYFSKDKPTAKAMPATPASPAVATATTPGVAGAPGEAPTKTGLNVSWQQVAKWIEADPKMSSASAGLGTRLPFGSLKPPVIEPDEQLESEQVVRTVEEATQDPEQLGLKLSATLLGGRRRVAVINGRAYAEGGEIEVGDRLVFVVTRVAGRHVVLECEGRRFELAVAQGPAAMNRANFEIQPAGRSIDR